MAFFLWFDFTIFGSRFKEVGGREAGIPEGKNNILHWKKTRNDAAINGKRGLLRAKDK